MQHLNDDMDDLFRKAADDYPLKTGVPDWNKVAMGLSDAAAPAPIVRERRYRRFLWFFLLIPIGFIVKEIADPVLFRGMLGADNKSAGTEVQNSKTNDQNPRAKGNSAKADDAQASLATVEQSGDIASARISPDTEAKEEIAGESQDNLAQPGAGKINPGAGNIKSGAEKTESGKPIRNQHNYQNNNNNKNGSLRKMTGGIGEATTYNSRTRSSATQIKDNGVLTLDDRNKGDKNTEMNATNIDPYAKTSLVPFSASPDVRVVPARNITALQPGPITKQRQKTKNFYLGVIGGLDLTTVKFQETSKMGSHYGAMAGYSFAKKWSVEVGFIVEKKYYYTDGQYFDKSKLNLNANTSVISVDGDCKMFEIPISIKYDITNSYKSNFFVTGGLSSYIMKQEDYTMVYGYTSGSTSTHYYPYKNSSKNFFAEIRLTGGYAFKLPAQFSVRVEPYLNIPVAGVGYGKLNLMSAGINAGIFKRIF